LPAEYSWSHSVWGLHCPWQLRGTPSRFRMYTKYRQARTRGMTDAPLKSPGGSACPGAGDGRTVHREHMRASANFWDAPMGLSSVPANKRGKGGRRFTPERRIRPETSSPDLTPSANYTKAAIENAITGVADKPAARQTRAASFGHRQRSENSPSSTILTAQLAVCRQRRSL